ncbi:hypothetical protein EI94DRAFT_1753568 [Lactarius quietus]|nr:hypothetical protein EI94DRAFT_1753568 [Lactarius quietus]
MSEQLAEIVYAKNWGIAAELLDEIFEKHVLPYTATKTHLHSHGINDCSRHFHTQPLIVLEAFTRKWGLIPIPSLKPPSV